MLPCAVIALLLTSAAFICDVVTLCWLIDECASFPSLHQAWTCGAWIKLYHNVRVHVSASGLTGGGGAIWEASIVIYLFVVEGYNIG